MIYLQLFLGFLKVGCFSFGGGYAAIALIRDVVLEYGWLDETTLTNMIAVGESTPGPIIVNLATYVGVSQAGIPGGLVATFASVLPAFVILILAAAAFRKLMTNGPFQAVLKGLRSCVIGIILGIGIYMTADSLFHFGEGLPLDPKEVILVLILSAVMFIPRTLKRKVKVSPILLMCIAAGLGMILF